VPCAGESGFSLVEILVAMGLFSVLSIALIALLRQSTGFLERGHAGSEIQDAVQDAERMFEDDFGNVWIRSSSPEGEPDVRFWADEVPFDVTGDGMPDVEAPRLAFVRSLPGEVTDRQTRGAGEKPGARGRLDGVDDERELAEKDLRAPGGKLEVQYFLVPGRKAAEPGQTEGDAAVGVLYRGQRTPIGGNLSFLPWDPVAPRMRPDARAGIWTREAAAERLRPVFGGILHLSFEFWTRTTKRSDSGGEAGGTSSREVGPGDGGLSPTWDSTRGIMPAGAGPGRFYLARGAASLAEPTDDVFPRRVRVTLVLERVGKDAAARELDRSIGEEDKLIPVSDTRFAKDADPASRFVKIGTEWIRWSGRDRDGFVVDQRGARGTRKQPHAAGDLVHSGVTVIREIDIPSFREDWND